jgi:Na+/H+-dicarboxylate symporter
MKLFKKLKKLIVGEVGLIIELIAVVLAAFLSNTIEKYSPVIDFLIWYLIAHVLIIIVILIVVIILMLGIKLKDLLKGK